LRTADGVAACSAEFKFKSVPNGVYRVGGRVLSPIPTKTPKPTFSDEARKFIKDQHIKKFEATSVVGETVDTIGMPQDICVLKEAGHGLDRKAFESVTEYRFIPATIDGKAVPVRLAIGVKFATF
jgi:Gram-negative bacterial TonB protein C-terminal